MEEAAVELTTSDYREALLACTCGGHHQQLTQIAAKHQNKNDVFNFEDILQSLSQKQYETLWAGLSTMSVDMEKQLRGFPVESEGNDAQIDVADVHSCLEAILVIMAASMELENPVPPKMVDSAVVLHDVMMDLPDSADKLRHKIVKLFQTWWVKDLPGKEDIAPNTLVCLLVKSLQPNAYQTDVKAVHSIGESLRLVKWSDGSSIDLEQLLEQCIACPNYLKINEGRNFLCGLFGLTPKLTGKFHAAVKNQLPSCSKSMAQHYGEIYFKAWRNATGENLNKIKQSCIQDLIYFAVHSSRKGSRPLATILFQVLGYFNQQKRQKGVDKMLYTLYEPILWRGLNANNANVRANAASLLIDVFPLQDPDNNKEEVDAMLQRQIDALNALLFDSSPTVRVIAIQGVCKVMSIYWELLPVATLSSFLSKLVQEVVYDANSPDVRTTVFKGLKFLLDNPLSHPLMKAILPSLGDFIHDVSEKVIVSFVELLLKVKGVRTVKVSSIVTIDHLLARLEVASPPLARRLVALLFNSFQPADQDPEVRIERIMRLIRANGESCRVFYRHAVHQMSTADAVDLMLLLCRCVKGCIRAAKGDAASSVNASGDSSLESSSSVTEREVDKENEDEEEEGLSLKDQDVMEGMLEIMALLWTGIGNDLAKPVNQPLKLKLVNKFSKAMPEFLATFQEARAVSAIMILASYMPASSIPSFSTGCLSSLKSLPVTASADSFGPLLTCLVSWGRGRDVLELINNWLDLTLTSKKPREEEAEDKDTSQEGKKKKRRVAFVEPVQPQPILALKFLDCLFGHYQSRTRLIQSCMAEVSELISTLQKAMPCLEQRFLTGTVLGFTKDEVLTKSIHAYLRVLIHVQSKFVSDEETTSDNHRSTDVEDLSLRFEELLAWMSRELVPSLMVPSPNTTGSARGGIDLGLHQLAKDTIMELLDLWTDSLMLDVCSSDLQDQLALFCRDLLSTDCSSAFLPVSVKMMYQLSQKMLEGYLASPELTNQREGAITSLLVTIVKCLSKEINKTAEDQADHMSEVLSTIKPGMTESLKLCQRHRVLCPSLDQNVVSSLMIAVVSEMSASLIRSGQAPIDPADSIALLPTLPAFLLGAATSTNIMLGSFLAEIHQCVRTGALEKTSELCAVIHILHTLQRDKRRVDGLEDCLKSVESELDSVESAPSDEDKKEDDLIMDKFWLYESRKILNGLLGKDPPPNPIQAEVDGTDSSTTTETPDGSSLNKTKKKLYNSGGSSLI